MAAISATPSSTLSLQSGLGKARVEQARREANQAEAKARSLRAQADEAESQAQQSQGRLRDVSRRNQQVDPTYKRALQGGQSTGRFLNLSV